MLSLIYVSEHVRLAEPAGTYIEIQQFKISVHYKLFAQRVIVYKLSVVAVVIADEIDHISVLYLYKTSELGLRKSRMM